MRSVLAIAVVAGLLELSGCGRTESKETPPPTTPEHVDSPPILPQIRVEAVSEVVAPVEEIVVPGKIEVNPGSLSKVSLPLAGRVVRVLAAVGDFVEKGKPLLVLDSPDTGTAVSNYRQALAKVTQAKSGVAKAEADLAREEDLYSHGAVAEKDVLSAKAQLTQAQSEQAQANASQEETLRKLRIFDIDSTGKNDHVIVPAPVSGKILDLSVVAGEYRNDISAPVMTIADLSSVFMTADVPETSIRLVELNEQCEAKLDSYPGETFIGRVRSVGDTVDPATRTVKVRVVLKNSPERFRPEMFGQLRISGDRKRMISIPASAVVQTSANQTVFREQSPGKYEPVQVTTGPRMGERIAVLSGLSKSSRIVVDGAMLVRSQNQ